MRLTQCRSATGRSRDGSRVRALPGNPPADFASRPLWPRDQVPEGRRRHSMARHGRRRADHDPQVVPRTARLSGSARRGPARAGSAQSVMAGDHRGPASPSTGHCSVRRRATPRGSPAAAPSRAAVRHRTPLAAAIEAGADGMVRGAWRRSRLLEWMLGGETRHVPRHATLPLLLLH